MMGTNFFTVAAVAALLSVTPKAVRQRISRGELPYRRWGRRILIPAVELEEFLAALPGQSARQAVSAVEEGGRCR